MDCLDKNSIERAHLLKGLNGVTETLKVIQEAIKDDPTLNKKVTKAYTKNSTREHVTMEDDTKKAKSDKVNEEPTRAVLISTVKPITRPNPKVALIKSSTRPSITDPVLEIYVPQQTSPVTQKEGNGIATNEKLESSIKRLVPASKDETQKIGLDPKIIVSAKAGKKFKKDQDAEHQVLKRENSQKVKRLMELNKKRAEVTKLDELDLVIHKKKNIIVNDLMIFLGKRKRQHMELESQIKMPGLECNRSLPEGVPFVNNMVIEEPEYGIFFTDVFGDQAFERWNDIHKVRVDSLVSYLVMASMIKTLENSRFGLKLKKLIAEHPEQEKLQSKKVKVEAIGYKLD
uniref:Copia protein n=1 Tax=Tanacetum cinerariifolium TaxID=118510 RepID=A0A6L2MC79_TANCI|nr:copia protein [Tanacetum cinerariifolium]